MDSLATLPIGDLERLAGIHDRWTFWADFNHLPLEQLIAAGRSELARRIRTLHGINHETAR